MSWEIYPRILDVHSLPQVLRGWGKVWESFFSSFNVHFLIAGCFEFTLLSAINSLPGLNPFNISFHFSIYNHMLKNSHISCEFLNRVSKCSPSIYSHMLKNFNISCVFVCHVSECPHLPLHLTSKYLVENPCYQNCTNHNRGKKRERQITLNKKDVECLLIEEV